METADLVVSSITIIVVLLFGGWILRLYGERERTMKEAHASQQQNWESQKTLLEERLTAKDEQLDQERRHVERMADLNEGNEKLLQRRLEGLQREAGVDPEAPLSDAPPAIPADIRQNMLETLGQLKDIRTVVEQLAPVATTYTLGAADHGLRGMAYYHAGQYEEALEAYNRALELQPDDPASLNNRGIILDDLRHYDDALADYNRALELDPDHADALVNRGVALAHLGRGEKAVADYDRALELRPRHAWTLSNRGVALALLGRKEEALSDFDRALDLQPSDPGVFYDRAAYHALSSMPDEAIEDLRRATTGDQQHLHAARTDSFLDNIRDDPRFRELVGEDERPPETEAPQR